MANTLVNLRNVDKVFHRGSEDLRVLRRDLDINEGEFLALMGAVGIGLF